MRRFKKVTIVGPGLIGGSIGLALKRLKACGEVAGVFRRRSSMKKAVKIGAVDHGTLDLSKGVANADIVIVAANVGTIPGLAIASAGFMKPGSILTDVGSVKVDIVNRIKSRMPEGVSFIGSHPMAGSEKKGVEFADPDIFKGSTVIITRTSRTETKAISVLSALWRAIGSKVIVMDPKTHDKIVSIASHLPHAAAIALCLAQSKDTLALASGGFRDTARIASSDPDMWLDIFRSNRRAILSALDRFIGETGDIRDMLSCGDFAGLRHKMKKAKAIRDSVNA